MARTDTLDGKEYHKNPRTISDKQMSQLKEWLTELGDLSGIVKDIKTGEIVGGNQRTKILKGSKIEIVKKFTKPTKQGTVAIGYVIHDGERYAYREVKWNERQMEKANIIANKAGGEFNFEILENQFSVDDLVNWGFEREEFGEPAEKEVVENEPSGYDQHKLWFLNIEFSNEKDCETLYNDLTQKGFQCKIVQ